MNTITITAPITRVTQYPNAIGIQCHDNMFPEKSSKYSTRITGSQMEKWGKNLAEGYIIVYQGSIAETKTASCGAYNVVYNPQIQDVYRLIPERIAQTAEEHEKKEQE